jgi:hypothetical protein
MTIRIQHLTIDPTHDTYLRAPEDGTDALSFVSISVRERLLGFVRHILRDERCDMVPVILAATIHPVNQFGHNMQVEVTYSRRGYRAIFAGLATPDSLTNVQCYMD